MTSVEINNLSSRGGSMWRLKPAYCSKINLESAMSLMEKRDIERWGMASIEENAYGANIL